MLPPVFPAILAGICLFLLSRFFPFLSIALFIIAGAAVLRKGRYYPALLVAAGFLVAALRFDPAPDPATPANRYVLVECVTDGIPREIPSGRWEIKGTVRSSDTPALAGREVWVVSDLPLASGRLYSLRARTGKEGRMNPGTITFNRTTLFAGEVLKEAEAERNPIIAWFSGRREGLTLLLRERFPGDAGIFLASILTGEGPGMSEDLRDAFSTTGLAHLLSISGTHFGLFSLLIFWTIRLFVRSLPYRLLQRITVFVTPSQAAAAFSLPFMAIYLLISGSSIPAVRSFIMISLFLFGLLIGRRGFWLNSLLLAAVLISVWDPSALLSLSFQLSFAAVLSIGLAVGGREQGSAEDLQDSTGKSGKLHGRVLRTLRESLLISLAASIGTAPLVVYAFHYLSLVSPAANLLVTPLVGFLLLPVALSAGFTFLFSGYFPFSGVIGLLTDLTLKGVRLLASVPFADLRIPGVPASFVVAFYLGVCLYFLIRKGHGWPGSWALPVSVVLVLFSLLPVFSRGGDMAVTFLDVGQGDAAIVEASGRTIVIDTGRTGREAGTFLRYLGSRDIDALVLTHADDDHSAGASYLAGHFRVREIWDNGLLRYPESLSAISRRSLGRGDVVTAPGIAVQVLHPYPGFYTLDSNGADEENNSSLVLRVAGRRHSFLFTADISAEAEEDLLSLGPYLESSVLKVSHHGSRSSSSPGFIASVSPALAVISAGRDNPYGHPHKETLRRLRGIRLYRTERDGAIKVTEGSTGLTVKTCRDMRFERGGTLDAEWRNLTRLFQVW